MNSINSKINFRSWFHREDEDRWFFRLVRPYWHKHEKYPFDKPFQGVNESGEYRFFRLR